MYIHNSYSSTLFIICIWSIECLANRKKKIARTKCFHCSVIFCFLCLVFCLPPNKYAAPNNGYEWINMAHELTGTLSRARNNKRNKNEIKMEQQYKYMYACELFAWPRINRSLHGDVWELPCTSFVSYIEAHIAHWFCTTTVNSSSFTLRLKYSAVEQFVSHGQFFPSNNNDIDDETWRLCLICLNALSNFLYACIFVIYNLAACGTGYYSCRVFIQQKYRSHHNTAFISIRV